jgi:hypothetical protein
MGEEHLTRIPAHSRRVNYRRAHLVATLMCDGARFTKPALPIPRAFGTDLGGGLDATPLAAYPAVPRFWPIVVRRLSASFAHEGQQRALRVHAYACSSSWWAQEPH